MLEHKKLRVIPPEAFSGPMNMALDHILLQGSGTTLRFYLWDRPTLSLGFSQKKSPDVSIDFCREKGIPFVLRETGGQAVLHHLELTYSVAGDSADFSRSILKTYQAISGPLTHALQSLGLDVTMAEHPKTGNPSQGAEKSGNCFQAISNFEVATGGKKLIGSAQVRKGKRFLQHGSLLLDIQPDLWEGLWPQDGGITELKKRFTSLQDEGVTIEGTTELSQRIAAAFQEDWGVTLDWGSFSTEEIDAAQQIEDQFIWAE